LKSFFVYVSSLHPTATHGLASLYPTTYIYMLRFLSIVVVFSIEGIKIKK
jgi:hypothetical protein